MDFVKGRIYTVSLHWDWSDDPAYKEKRKLLYMGRTRDHCNHLLKFIDINDSKEVFYYPETIDLMTVKYELLENVANKVSGDIK